MSQQTKFKEKTEKFFDDYNEQKEVDINQSPLDRFLMEKYYLSISGFLSDNIRDIIANDDARILDIGCGAGDYLIHLADKFKKGYYYGVDISQSALDSASANIKKEELISSDPFLLKFRYSVEPERFQFNKTDGIHLPFADNYFDVVYFIMILHHTEEYTEIIKEASRVLKPSGKLLIIDLKGQSKIEKNLIRFFFKLTPDSIIRKVFKNDLVLADGEIPFRSNVDFRKTEDAIKKASLKISKKKTFNYFLSRWMLFFIKLVWDNRIAFLLKPFLHMAVYFERKISFCYEAYYFVCQKNNSQD